MSINSSDAQTKPTLETVLQRINSLGTELRSQLDSVQRNDGSIRSDLSSLNSEVGSLRNEFQLFEEKWRFGLIESKE